MLGRFARDESGMTMALVVIMIVLIGVMGAGLLTFVQRDLENVIEVNRGQKAIEVTDAGVQAAKRELLVVSYPESYNGANVSDPGIKPESEWSASSPSTTCAGLPAGPGKCITTTEGNVRVTIRYLPPPPTAAQRGNPQFAPEALPSGATDYTDKRDYFRVEADGVFNGARRKVQAIMVTEDLGLPKAYFATKDIDLGPSCSALTVTNVSLFARGDITGLRDCTLKGTDPAYGNWQNTYNNKARLGRTVTSAELADGLLGTADAAGAAAEGSISYQGGDYDREQKEAPAENSDRYKRLDFDGTENLASGSPPPNPTPNYRFCDKGTACWPAADTSQPPDVITYPFDDGKKLDASFLQSVAEQQISPTTGNSNYVVRSTSTSVDANRTTFHQVSPALSSVFVVRFTGTPGTVDIQPTGSASPTCPLKGTILVINGSVNTSSSGAQCFDGIVAVQDPGSVSTLEYDSMGGSFVLNGFLSVEGEVTLGGNVNPILGLDALNHPGYHNVKIWSWRECYNTTCTS